ncbi:MAG: ABC transporter permease [Lachnospiraceae bacterium]|nr:ABC transporter permease [Lachnospiraceae bacterium]
MIVFKCFLKMIKRNAGMMILYFAIFFTVCLLMQFAADGKGVEDFEEERLDICVIDRDKGTLARELTKYLERHHHLVELPDDQAVIQEELFYRNVYYVAIIPRDFAGKLQTVKVPGTTSAFYVDRQIDQFLNQVKILEAAGYEGEELYEKAAQIDEIQAEVELVDKNGHGGEVPAYAYMFQYMPYIIFSIICYIIAYIMIGFRKKEVRRRMECAAMPLRQQNFQLILGYLVLGVGIWAVCMLLPVLLYGKSFLRDGNMILYMANAFAVMVVSLAVAFTVGTVVRREEVVSSVVNVISLGMSFLCGVFVSMEVLGKGVRMFAQFLPFYWYECVNQILARNAVFTAQQRWDIVKGLGIQGLFAVAVICVGMVLDRWAADR